MTKTYERSNLLKSNNCNLYYNLNLQMQCSFFQLSLHLNQPCRARTKCEQEQIHPLIPFTVFLTQSGKVLINNRKRTWTKHIKTSPKLPPETKI